MNATNKVNKSYIFGACFLYFVCLFSAVVNISYGGLEAISYEYMQEGFYGWLATLIAATGLLYVSFQPPDSKKKK